VTLFWCVLYSIMLHMLFLLLLFPLVPIFIIWQYLSFLCPSLLSAVFHSCISFIHYANVVAVYCLNLFVYSIWFNVSCILIASLLVLSFFLMAYIRGRDFSLGPTQPSIQQVLGGGLFPKG